MTADEAALLAAVAATPADDAPRLVYADWLQERGHDVRAEFIRLQCAIAAKADLPQWERNRHVGLWQRQQEILDAAPPDLLGPLSNLSPEVTIASDRGFVSEVTLHVRDFLTFGEQLETTVPLPRITVTNATAQPVAFLGSRHLGCVTAVRAYDENPINERFEGWLITAAGQQLTRLDTLDLEGVGIDDVSIALILAVSLPSLADLDLSNNALSDAIIPLLIDSPLPRQLRRLILGGNPIGDQGAIELADRWPRTSPLEHLNLRFTNIGQPGIRAISARFGGKADYI